MSDSAGEPRSSGPTLTVLLFTDLVGSTALKRAAGDASYFALLRRHNELFETAIAEVGGKIIKHTGDGYFATFSAASDAARFALNFQRRIGSEPWGPHRMSTRVGIHAGEVQTVRQAGQEDVIGYAADIAARLMSLASGGQILLTRQAFDDARKSVKDPGVPEHESSSASSPVQPGPPQYAWLAHGPYLFNGADEPVDIYELGMPGLSPLRAPANSEKARRILSIEQEQLLGWRPASGLAVPFRKGWFLEQQVGIGGFGEVWVARQQRTKQRRAFKFCFDVDRLRSLKRELTLFKLLREALGERADIARLYDVQLDEPPYFLESEYTPGGNLNEWSERRGGIKAVPLERRLALLAQIADAVAAAHSVGVLHKDIKPSNILIQEGSALAPNASPDEPAGGDTIQPKLSDFGIGILADTNKLGQHAVTPAGFTAVTEQNDSSRTGTRIYAPPELLAGRPFSTKGDIYALGVLLYQLVIGDLGRPLGVGWERDVSDELITDDIAQCVDNDPERRLDSAGRLSERLRTLAERRARLQRDRDSASRLAKANTRRRMLRIALIATVCIAAVGFLGGLKYVRDLRAEQAATLHQKAEADRRRVEADQERENAQASLDFLTNDVLAGATPERMPDRKARDEIVRVMIDPAAAKVGQRFANRPLLEAEVRTALGNAYTAIGRPDLALVHFQEAAALRERTLGGDDVKTLRSGDSISRVLTALGRMSEAEKLERGVLEKCVRLLGPQHLTTIYVTNNYAAILLTMGRAEEASPLFREVWQQRVARDGGTAALTLSAENNYANTLVALGKLSEAEPLRNEVMRERKTLLGARHLDTVTSVMNYAALLSQLERPAEAEPLLGEVLATRRAVQGDSHPHTIIAMHMLARTYIALARQSDAEPLLREACAAQARLTGQDSEEALQIRGEHVILLSDMRRFSEAEPLATEGLELALANKALGPAHALTRALASVKSACLKERGSAAEAAAILKEFALTDSPEPATTQP